jgi:2-deoxy-D-gluconate 3-dehydrogenase
VLIFNYAEYYWLKLVDNILNSILKYLARLCIARHCIIYVQSIRDINMSTSDNIQPLAELISLKEKRAIITGGAAGIGFGIAQRFAEAGAVVFIADIAGDIAKNATKNLENQGYTAYSSACDIRDETSVQEMVNMAISKMGGIDILVNNAGIYPRKTISEMGQKDFNDVISVNLTGAFLCSKYAAEQMIKQLRGGCIINIASIEALHPASTGMSAYDASKGGLLMLTRSMAKEMGQHGIRVNAVAPGAILTRGLTSQMGNLTQEQQMGDMKELKRFMSRMVLGRMGDADDIARVALFLASELSSYITGELIIADGGYLLG